MPWFIPTRSIAVAACGALLLQSWSAIAHGQEDLKYVRTTIAYKSVDGLDILADVHRPDDESQRAIVVWIHGGALINGHREGISGRVREYVQSRGHALVSIDYRLAPETKLPDIIADVEDAFEWIRGEGAEQFNLDAERLVVTGGSAGGYLTLVTGYRVQPRPRALLPFWGYGDLIGEWYSSPSPHPRHNRVKYTREEAWQQVCGKPISDSRERDGSGGIFYNFCRQTGAWPMAVSGWDPHTEAEKFDAYMPVRNVTERYSPTFMIHGTADTDVPHEQSKMMAEEFDRHGVEYHLESIEGGEHGLGGGDRKAIDLAYQRAWAFLDKHLQSND